MNIKYISKIRSSKMLLTNNMILLVKLYDIIMDCIVYKNIDFLIDFFLIISFSSKDLKVNFQEENNKKF